MARTVPAEGISRCEFSSADVAVEPMAMPMRHAAAINRAACFVLS